jgi:hypothetical protein
MSLTSQFRCVALAVLALALVPSFAGATNAVIDDSISLITVQGTLSNGQDTLPVTEQAPGSLQTSLSGQLSVDISGGNISFLGGLIVPANQGGSFLPFSTDAQLAGEVADILPGITAVGSFRNFEFDVSSGPIPLNPDGTFDASGIFFNSLNGTFDYEVPGILGPFSDSLGGLASAGSLTGSVELQPDGRYEVIVPFSLSFLTTIDELTLDLTAAGRIFAVTPEPSSYVLAVMAALSLAGMVYRRHK